MARVRPRHTPKPLACEFHGELGRYLRDPQGYALPTGLARNGPMRLYTDLILNNMDSQVSPCFPVTRAILGKRRWRLLIREFLSHHSCKTPYFHEIPGEFLRYVRLRAARQEEEPVFLNEIVHYEWSELVLSLSADVALDDVEMPGDLATRIPVLNPILAISDYRYPVHRITTRAASTKLQPSLTHILGFRKPDYSVAFLCLNPVTLELLSLLFEGRFTGVSAIQSTLQKLELPKTEAALEGGLAILEDLRVQGAIVGVRRENRGS